MDSNEQITRETWKRVSKPIVTQINGVQLTASKEPEHGLILLTKSFCHDEEEAWAAAVEFTHKRLEQIREIEEEIELLSGWRFVVEANPAAQRIIANRKSALAEIRKGMKV